MIIFSAAKVLAPDGQIMVTLCKGQGGTPADQPMRAWHDSWQVVSMAANASLILTDILPFSTDDYPQYNSVGFRYVVYCTSNITHAPSTRNILG